MRIYKIVLLGSGGIGKSALVVQFVCGTFVEKYDPTIEDFYRKEIDVDDFPTIVEILDTAGTEQFTSMRNAYIKKGQGFMLVYSIINAQTFIDVQLLKDQISRVKGSAVSPIIIVGNKCDMEPERAVTTRDGEILAREWRVPFFETSAKTNFNIYEVFAEIVRQIKKDWSYSAVCCTVL